MQRIFGLLTLGLAIICTGLIGPGSGGSAEAQFGGYQDMTLDKIHRRQAADARQLGRGGPVGPVVPPRRPVINKNYYISPYVPYGYGYGYPYGYGYNYGYGGPYGPGYGYYGWQQSYLAQPPMNILVQPQVQVNPMLVPPGQGQAAAGANAQGQAGRHPLAGQAGPGQAGPGQAGPGQAGAAAPEDEILRRVSVLKPSNEAGRMRADTLIADGDREFAAQQYRRAASKYREAIGRAPIIPQHTCEPAMPTPQPVTTSWR